MCCILGSHSILLCNGGRFSDLRWSCPRCWGAAFCHPNCLCGWPPPFCCWRELFLGGLGNTRYLKCITGYLTYSTWYLINKDACFEYVSDELYSVGYYCIYIYIYETWAWTSLWSPIGSGWELRTKFDHFSVWNCVPRLFGVFPNR